MPSPLSAPRFLFGRVDVLSDCEPPVLLDALDVAEICVQLPPATRLLLLRLAQHLRETEQPPRALKYLGPKIVPFPTPAPTTHVG